MYVGKCKIRKRTSLKNVLYDILWNLRIDHYLWSGPIKHRKEGVSSSMFGKVPRWNPLLWRIHAMPAAAGNDPEGAQILYLDCTQYINLYEIYVVAVNFKRQFDAAIRVNFVNPKINTLTQPFIRAQHFNWYSRYTNLKRVEFSKIRLQQTMSEFRQQEQHHYHQNSLFSSKAY